MIHRSKFMSTNFLFKRPMVVVKVFAVWVTVAGATGRLFANDQIPGGPQQRPVLIRGATVHRIDGDPIVGGSVLFVDGVITRVGSEIERPENAEVIDASGKHLYPGLIESMTDLGLREIEAVDVTVDRQERGERNPNVRAWIAVNPDSELIPVARAGGVLVGHVSPGGPFVRGQTAVMHLDGWSAADMTLAAPAGLSINWNYMVPADDDSKKQAELRRERLAELNEWFDQARRYRDSQRDNPDEITDVRLQSLLPVLDGEQTIYAQADSRVAIQSAVTFCQANSIKLVIVGGYDALRCRDLLVQLDIPVIVGGTYRLPQRRDDPYDAPYTLPARLQKAGIRFAVAGEGAGYPGGSSNARNLPYHAANAVAYGLSPDDALRSITLSAAEILGVDDQIGSISVGKLATLILCDGDILQTQSNVTEAFIAGRRVDLSSKHTTLYHKYRQKYKPQSSTRSD